MNFVMCSQIEWALLYDLFMLNAHRPIRGHRTDSISNMFISSMKWLGNILIKGKWYDVLCVRGIIRHYMCVVCWFYSITVWTEWIPINNVEIAWNWRIVYTHQIPHNMHTQAHNSTRLFVYLFVAYNEIIVPSDDNLKDSEISALR